MRRQSRLHRDTNNSGSQLQSKKNMAISHSNFRLDARKNIQLINTAAKWSECRAQADKKKKRKSEAIKCTMHKVSSGIVHFSLVWSRYKKRVVFTWIIRNSNVHEHFNRFRCKFASRSVPTSAQNTNQTKCLISCWICHTLNARIRRIRTIFSTLFISCEKGAPNFYRSQFLLNLISIKFRWNKNAHNVWEREREREKWANEECYAHAVYKLKLFCSVSCIYLCCVRVFRQYLRDACFATFNSLSVYSADINMIMASFNENEKSPLRNVQIKKRGNTIRFV